MKVENTLTAHQQVLMELWSEFDNICCKHQIRYMLFAGSALGAVRHQGIIPWDDDLDVVMLRKDYERFMQIAECELDQNKYFLQREFADHWPMFFSKLRKNNTACIERYIPKDPLMHQGIYIDIFPCDNLSDNPIRRSLQYFASKIVIARSLDERGYLTNNIMKKVFILICRHIPQKILVDFVQNRKEQKSKRVHTFFGGARDYKKNIYPRKWLTKTIFISFGGKKAPVSKYYDELLTRLYGDYLIPLPEEQRSCKIHAEFVDTEHSYKQYWDIQSKMHFEEYTRSIR